MVRPLGLQHGAHNDSLLIGRECWARTEHPLHGRRSQVEAGSAEKFGELHLAEGRTQDLEPLNDVADEVWELVHGLSHLQQGLGPVLIEASHPGDNRVPGQMESLSELPSREAVSCSELKDRHPFGRRIVGSPPGVRPAHPGVLEAKLLGEQGEFAPEIMDFGQQPGPE